MCTIIFRKSMNTFRNNAEQCVSVQRLQLLCSICCFFPIIKQICSKHGIYLVRNLQT